MIDPDRLQQEISQFLGTAKFDAKVVPGVYHTSCLYSFKTGLSCVHRAYVPRCNLYCRLLNLQDVVFFEVIGNSSTDSPMYVEVTCSDVSNKVKLPLHLRLRRYVLRFLTGGV